MGRLRIFVFPLTRRKGVWGEYVKGWNPLTTLHSVFRAGGPAVCLIAVKASQLGKLGPGGEDLDNPHPWGRPGVFRSLGLGLSTLGWSVTENTRYCHQMAFGADRGVAGRLVKERKLLRI